MVPETRSGGFGNDGGDLLPHVEVHHPLLVVENPQTDQLARQILHIFVRVLHAHADQHQQALPDPGQLDAADADGSVLHTLNQQSHIFR